MVNGFSLNTDKNYNPSVDKFLSKETDTDTDTTSKVDREKVTPKIDTENIPSGGGQVLKKAEVVTGDNKKITIEFFSPKNATEDEQKQLIKQKLIERERKQQKETVGDVGKEKSTGFWSDTKSWYANIIDVLSPTNLVNLVDEEDRPLREFRKWSVQNYPMATFLGDIGVPIAGAHYGSKFFRKVGNLGRVMAKPKLAPFSVGRYAGTGGVGFLVGLATEVALQNSGLGEESDAAYYMEALGPAAWKGVHLAGKALRAGVRGSPFTKQAIERMQNLRLSDRVEIYREGGRRLSRMRGMRGSKYGSRKGLMPGAGSPSQIAYDKLSQYHGLRFRPSDYPMTKTKGVLNEIRENLPEDIVKNFEEGNVGFLAINDLLTLIQSKKMTSLGDIVATMNTLRQMIYGLDAKGISKWKKGYRLKILQAVEEDLLDKPIKFRNKAGQFVSDTYGQFKKDLDRARKLHKEEMAQEELSTFFSPTIPAGAQDILYFTKKGDIPRKKLDLMSKEELVDAGYKRIKGAFGTKYRRFLEEPQYDISNLYNRWVAKTQKYNKVDSKFGKYDKNFVEGLGKEKVRVITEFLKDFNSELQRKGGEGGSLAIRMAMSASLGGIISSVVEMITLGGVSGQSFFVSMVSSILGIRSPEILARTMSKPWARKLLAKFIVRPPKEVVEAYAKGWSIAGKAIRGATKSIITTGVPIGSAEASEGIKGYTSQLENPYRLGRIDDVTPEDWGFEYEVQEGTGRRRLEGISPKWDPDRSMPSPKLPSIEKYISSPQFMQNTSPKEMKEIIEGIKEAKRLQQIEDSKSKFFRGRQLTGETTADLFKRRRNPLGLRSFGTK